jgi:hypothetical protein
MLWGLRAGAQEGPGTVPGSRRPGDEIGRTRVHGQAQPDRTDRGPGSGATEDVRAAPTEVRPDQPSEQTCTSSINSVQRLSETALATDTCDMGAPVEGEVEALLSDATAALRDGSNRLDVLDDAVSSILATLRALSTVLDRLEGEVAQLRGEVAATRKIAKQAKKRAGKA